MKNEITEDLKQRLAETISTLTYILEEMGGNIVIDVLGNQYGLEEVTKHGDEIVIYASADEFEGLD